MPDVRATSPLTKSTAYPTDGPREPRRDGFSAPVAQPTAELDFTTLYQENVTRIYRYHLARTGSVTEAQDLTSETFRAALESFSRYNPTSGSPSAWLAGIAHHKLVDYFRRYRPVLPLESVENEPQPGFSTEERASRRLDVQRAARALKTLSPERAEALSLHYFAGLTPAEIAQVMGKREEAVRKLLQRGLDDLKDRLGARKEAQG